jgi:hypothetical protein
MWISTSPDHAVPLRSWAKIVLSYFLRIGKASKFWYEECIPVIKLKEDEVTNEDQ